MSMRDERELFGDEQAYIAWMRQQEAEAKAEALRQERERRAAAQAMKLQKIVRKRAKPTQPQSIQSNQSDYRKHAPITGYMVGPSGKQRNEWYEFCRAARIPFVYAETSRFRASLVADCVTAPEWRITYDGYDALKYLLDVYAVRKGMYLSWSADHMQRGVRWCVRGLLAAEAAGIAASFANILWRERLFVLETWRKDISSLLRCRDEDFGPRFPEKQRASCAICGKHEFSLIGHQYAAWRTPEDEGGLPGEEGHWELLTICSRSEAMAYHREVREEDGLA